MGKQSQMLEVRQLEGKSRQLMGSCGGCGGRGDRGTRKAPGMQLLSSSDCCPGAGEVQHGP